MASKPGWIVELNPKTAKGSTFAIFQTMVGRNRRTIRCRLLKVSPTAIGLTSVNFFFRSATNFAPAMTGWIIVGTFPPRRRLLKEFSEDISRWRSPFALWLVMSFNCCGLRLDCPPADSTGKNFNAMSSWISLAWNGGHSSSGKTSRSTGLVGCFSLSLIRISADSSRTPLSELARRTAFSTSPSSSFSLTGSINCSTSVCWLELCLSFVRGFRSTRSRFCMNIVIRLFNWVARDCFWLFLALNGASSWENEKMEPSDFRVWRVQDCVERVSQCRCNRYPGSFWYKFKDTPSADIREVNNVVGWFDDVFSDSDICFAVRILEWGLSRKSTSIPRGTMWIDHQAFRELDGSRAPLELCAFQIGSFLVHSRRHLFGCDLRSPKTLIVISSNFSSNSVGKSLFTLGGGEFGWYGDGGADWEGWLWVRMPLVSLHPDPPHLLNSAATHHGTSRLQRCASLHLCKKDFFVLGLGKAWFWWVRIPYIVSAVPVFERIFFTDDLRFQCFSISESNLQFRASRNVHLVLNTHSLSFSLSLSLFVSLDKIPRNS